MKKHSILLALALVGLLAACDFKITLGPGSSMPSSSSSSSSSGTSSSGPSSSDASTGSSDPTSTGDPSSDPTSADSGTTSEPTSTSTSEPTSTSGPTSTSEPTSTSTSEPTSTSSSASEPGGPYYQSPSLDSIQAMSVDKSESLGALGPGNTPSTGEVKLLIVPVYFSNVDAPSPAELTNIERIFFGSPSETDWQSLASFYATSSYGALDFSQGLVSDSYMVDMTDAEFQENYELGSDMTAWLADEVVAWAEGNGVLDPSFDSNDDGFYDGIEMVYFTSLTEADNRDLWWAYTSCAHTVPGDTDPVAGHYFWTGYRFICDRSNTPTTDLDAHTIIHETGHMLGLDDYYDYSNSSFPAGCSDMMDFNIGDHNGFSKMLLGWVAPKVLDRRSSRGSFTLHLDSFTETGQCFLIQMNETDGWNGTAYDEYLLLQYYTPTGLNEADSDGYPEWNGYGHGGTYEHAGLQLFHVDARAATTRYHYDHENYVITDLYYDDEPKLEDTSFGSYREMGSFIAASNTAEYSTDVESSQANLPVVYGEEDYEVADSPYRMLTAIPADKSAAFLGDRGYRSLGLDSVLFTAAGGVGGGSAFDLASFSDLFPNGNKTNEGATSKWSFEVIANDDSGCDIRFTHSS